MQDLTRSVRQTDQTQYRSREPGAEPRVTIIGPILPYRGGIAQHTTMLHRALRERCDLLTISFKRQYPAWLFPGESDLDPAYQGYEEPGVDYCIDSINPLTWRKAVTAISAFEPQAVIIPWWTVYWAICFRSTANSPNAIRGTAMQTG